MEPLFDKSTDELREAFVLARFAEPAIFDRPDIEEWLEGQRKTRKPDETMESFIGFESLISRHVPHPLTVEYLHLYAAPLRNPLKNWTCWTMDYEKIARAVLKSGGKLYPTVDDEFVLVIDDKGYVVTEIGIEVFDPTQFLWVILTQWSRKGRKSDTARAFCCDAFSRRIAAARKAAETDFNEAVAVSADGTKIVKADDVAVILDNNRIAIYPASTFVANKILRSDNMARVQAKNEGNKSDYRDRFLLSEIVVQPRASGQFLDCYSLGSQNRMRLVTEVRFCPSPLPDRVETFRI